MTSTLDELAAVAQAEREEAMKSAAAAAPGQSSQPGPTAEAAAFERAIRIERLKRVAEQVEKQRVMPGSIDPVSHGAMQGLGGPVAGVASALGGEVGEWFGGEPATFGERYEAGEGAYRDRLKAIEARHPVLSKTGEIAGSIISAPPVDSAVTGILGLTGRSAGVGAGMGFAHGVGTGEGDWRDRVFQGVVEGGTGGILGGSLGAGSAYLADPARTQLARRMVSQADEFGIPLTRGQATRDPTQQRVEQELLHGQRGDPGQQRMQDFARRQEEARTGAAQDIRDRFAPYRGDTGTESGQGLVEGIRTRTQRLQDVGGRRINEALQQGVEVDATSMRGLTDRITQEIAGANPQVPNVILSENTPIANEAMTRIRRFTDMIPDDPSARISLAGAEELRQRLSPLQAHTPNDARALNAVRDAFENWFDEAIQGASAGAEGAALQHGRDLYRRGASLERPRGRTTPAEKNVARLAAEDATGKDAYDMFKVTQRGDVKPEAARTIGRLRIEFGPNSPTVQRVRDISLEGLLDGGPQRVANQIEGFLDRSRDVANQIFTPDQIAELRRFAETSRSMVPHETATNASRTSYGVMKTLVKSTLIGGGALLGQKLLGGGDNVAMDIGGYVLGGGAGKALGDVGGAFQANKAFNPIPSTTAAMPVAMATARAGAQQTPDRDTMARLMAKRELGR